MEQGEEGSKERAKGMKVQAECGARKYSNWLTKGRWEDRAVFKTRKHRVSQKSI